MDLSDLKDGVFCKVMAGTHKGKKETLHDIKTSKSGEITITLKQDDGLRFKTLARSVEIQK